MADRRAVLSHQRSHAVIDVDARVEDVERHARQHILEQSVQPFDHHHRRHEVEHGATVVHPVAALLAQHEPPREQRHKLHRGVSGCAVEPLENRQWLRAVACLVDSILQIATLHIVPDQGEGEGDG